jgi:hypothetical protein
LGLPALLGLSYHEYTTRGGLRAVFSFWARIGIACLVLCIPLFIAHPNWIPDMLTAMGKNPPWAYPSLMVLFRRTLGWWGSPLWVLTTLIVVAFNFYIWKKLPKHQALYWSLALAPLATPYIGSWDFVVLLPLLIFTYTNADWKRKVFIWMAYIAAWVLMAWIQQIPASLNYYFWWVPLCFIGTAALVTDWKNVPKVS